MSSYWGHGAGDEKAKERKRSFRKPRRYAADRRASLPCVSQLEAMQLKQFHITMSPAQIQLKSCKGKEMYAHPHVHRVASDEYGHLKGGGPESQISTIPELSESFERLLRSRNQRVMSLSDADNVCLICHQEIRNNSEREGGGQGGAQKHCSHHFHKEIGKVRRLEQDGRPRSRSSAAVCESRKETTFCTKSEGYHLPWHRFSLRRQR